MPQRIRCRFELYSSEVSGLPADVGAVRLLVEHNKVSKKYDYTDTLLASHGTTTQLEDLAGSQPLLAFTCHVYPSKVRCDKQPGAITHVRRDYKQQQQHPQEHIALAAFNAGQRASGTYQCMQHNTYWAVLFPHQMWVGTCHHLTLGLP